MPRVISATSRRGKPPRVAAAGCHHLARARPAAGRPTNPPISAPRLCCQPRPPNLPSVPASPPPPAPAPWPYPVRHWARCGLSPSPALQPELHGLPVGSDVEDGEAVAGALVAADPIKEIGVPPPILEAAIHHGRTPVMAKEQRQFVTRHSARLVPLGPAAA